MEKERGAEIIIFWIAFHREERLLGHAINLGVSIFLLIYFCWLLDLKVGGFCVASGCGVSKRLILTAFLSSPKKVLSGGFAVS